MVVCCAVGGACGRGWMCVFTPEPCGFRWLCMYECVRDERCTVECVCADLCVRASVCGYEQCVVWVDFRPPELAAVV